jgi:nucleotide-binding universal stress UspA family protein
MASSAEADGERRIGVAMDTSASSKRALDWAIRNLLRRGDTLVVLHVLHPGGDEAKRAALWAKSGSRKHCPDQIGLPSIPVVFQTN